eukprot:scaffold3890_cov33-Attheya_sp.AAC.7
MSSDDYVKEAVKTVDQKLSEIGKQLISAQNSKISGPTSPGYRPELDIFLELGPEKANYSQHLIGVLRWAVDIGRINIHIKIALSSSHLAMPRKRHLDQIQTCGALRSYSTLNHDLADIHSVASL